MGAENLYNSGIPGTYLGLPINDGLAPGDKGYTPPPKRQPVNNWQTLSNFLNGVAAGANEGKGAYPGPSTVSFDPSDPTGSSAQLRAALPKPQPNVPVQSPKIALPPAEPQTLGQITQQQIPAMSASPRTKEEFSSGVRRSYSGGGVSGTNDQQSLYSPTDYGSDRRNQGLSRNVQPELNISIPENEKKYQAPGAPPIPPGFVDIGNAIKEGYNWLENTGSDKLTPRQANNALLSMGEVPPGLSPEEATKLLMAQQGLSKQSNNPSVAPIDSSSPASATPAIPVPPQQNPELSPSQQPYGAFLQENPAATNRRISNQADVRSALKFGPQEAAMSRAAQEESNNNKQGLELISQGYKEVNNLQSAPGDYEGTPFYRKTTDITAEQLQKSDPARYKSLMELQALRESDAAAQAKQYQKTGLTPPPIVRKGSLNETITTIMQPNAPVTGRSMDPNAPKPFDMNNMEEYKVEVPGKGWMTGLRQKDPNRQQGTLSVVPGLSDSERQQLAQIEANQARQAAYGVSRRTGELYDAAQQHQQQQAALAALKQLQMMQEQAQFKTTTDLKAAEIVDARQRHKDTMDEKAAQLLTGQLNKGNEQQLKMDEYLAELDKSAAKEFNDYVANPMAKIAKGVTPWDSYTTNRLGLKPFSPESATSLQKTGGFLGSPNAGKVYYIPPGGSMQEVPIAWYKAVQARQANQALDSNIKSP